MRIILVLSLVGGFAAATTVAAVVVTVNPGSVGNVVINSVSGTGSAADPLVIDETMFTGDATLDIRGAPQDGDPSNSPFTWGIYVRKIVRNQTGITWDRFDHELQEVLGVPSPDGDGLSFGQGYAPFRPYTSDRFANVIEIDDVRDYLNFVNGSVLHGEAVTFTYCITDNSPIDLFYLRQRPNYIPEPASLALLALGGTLALRRR